MIQKILQLFIVLIFMYFPASTPALSKVSFKSDGTSLLKITFDSHGGMLDYEKVVPGSNTPDVVNKTFSIDSSASSRIKQNQFVSVENLTADNISTRKWIPVETLSVTNERRKVLPFTLYTSHWLLFESDRLFILNPGCLPGKGVSNCGFTSSEKMFGVVVSSGYKATLVADKAKYGQANGALQEIVGIELDRANIELTVELRDDTDAIKHFDRLHEFLNTAKNEESLGNWIYVDGIANAAKINRINKNTINLTIAHKESTTLRFNTPLFYSDEKPIDLEGTGLKAVIDIKPNKFSVMAFVPEEVEEESGDFIYFRNEEKNTLAFNAALGQPRHQLISGLDWHKGQKYRFRFKGISVISEFIKPNVFQNLKIMDYDDRNLFHLKFSDEDIKICKYMDKVRIKVKRQGGYADFGLKYIPTRKKDRCGLPFPDESKLQGINGALVFFSASSKNAITLTNLVDFENIKFEITQRANSEQVLGSFNLVEETGRVRDISVKYSGLVQYEFTIK